MRRFLIATISLWSLVSVLAVDPLAQSTSAIRGTVRDASGAPLPGVTIDATLSPR